jgi:hypothetical protein
LEGAKILIRGIEFLLEREFCMKRGAGKKGQEAVKKRRLFKR